MRVVHEKVTLGSSFCNHSDDGGFRLRDRHEKQTQVFEGQHHLDHDGNDIDLHNCATVWVAHGSQFRESKSVAALAWSGGTAADVHLGDTVILVAVI